MQNSNENCNTLEQKGEILGYDKLTLFIDLCNYIVFFVQKNDTSRANYKIEYLYQNFTLKKQMKNL